MDFFAHISQGFMIVSTPLNLMYVWVGVIIGTLIGVLPGLGISGTLAILLPLTYKMDPASAMIMLVGIFSGAMYGGSTTSILLNVPGEAASVVTCLDGYKMARQGRAGPALGISAIGSFIAGTFSVLALSMIGPLLASFALAFGPAEYSSLVFLGLLMAVYLSEQSILKGLITTSVGLFLATMGPDPVFGEPRFYFGINRLLDGVHFVTVVMGLFGIGEVLINLEASQDRDIFKTRIKNLLPTRQDWRRCGPAVLRGSILGFCIGCIPGGGAAIASFIAYAVEKRVSKHPEAFGTGVIEGVAAPESANNAAATAALTPLLTLGVPGTAGTAMLFVALMIHGIRPGPLLFQEHPHVFWGIIASLYLGNVFLLALNLPLIGIWVRFLKIPYHYLVVIILIICVIGSYSLNNSAFDVGIMMLFGVVGYFLRKGGFPAAPMVLAMILGRIFERSLRQTVTLSAGDLSIFIEKPIAALLLSFALIVMIIPVVQWLWKRCWAARRV